MQFKFQFFNKLTMFNYLDLSIRIMTKSEHQSMNIDSPECWGSTMRGFKIVDFVVVVDGS